MYKEDLLIYNDVRDEIQRDYILGVIFEKYRESLGYLPARIKAHAAIVSRPVEDDDEERQVYGLGQLIDMHSTLPTWLVPNLIGSGGGLYLVSGKPKSGKTLIFGYQLAYSLAVSGNFLGLPCQKCKVLFFECEEPLPTIVKRLRTKGFNRYCDLIENAVEEGMIEVERSFKIDADLSYLKNRVQEFGHGIVIYDSLRRITSHLEVSENDAKFASFVYTLQAMHNHLGVPGLLIHHNNKSGEGLNAVSGSGGIPGATDGVILLDPVPGQGKHTVVLETVPREGVPSKFKVQRCKDSSGFWSYEILEIMGVDPEIPKWEKRIIRLLCTELDKKYTKRQLIEILTPSDGLPFFSAALERLSESYQIGEDFTATGSTVYWISDTSPWSQDSRMNLSPEIGDADKLIACRSREEVQALNSAWKIKGEEYPLKVWNLLTDSEKESIKIILNPKKYEPGQWVKVTATDSAERIKGFTFCKEDGSWHYSVEGNSEVYIESDLKEHEDYVDYSHSL